MPDSSASPSPIQTEGGVPENIATTVVPEPKGSWGTAVIKLATLPFQAVGYLTVKPLETAYHHFFPVKGDVEFEDGCPVFSQIPTTNDKRFADAAWPPQGEPAPALPVKVMIDANAELVRKVCYASKLNEYEYQKYLLPVITNVAHFVHLLPASQDDHHQGYGGLFTHSLEVAFEAANLAKNTIFDRVSPPKEIQWNRRRWILICVLAGLVHDIGKPYTDLEVTTGPDEGGKSWKKSLPLLDWLRQEHIKKYYVSFLCDRQHNDHVSVALQKLEIVIPPETRAFINATGSGDRMDKALRDALLYGGTSKGGLIGSILAKADGESRNADKLLQRHIHPVYKNVSHPQGDPLLKAMLALVTSGKWKANNGVDSEVFNTKQGCFISWNEKVVKTIWDQATSMGYKGLPSDYLKIAEILVDAQAAVPNVGERGHILSTLWAVTPIMLKDQPVNCLRLRDYRYIYDSVAPTPIECVIEGTPPDAETVKAWETMWGCQPSPHIYLTEDELPEKGFDEEYMQAEIESQQARADEENEQLSAEAAAVEEYEREILKTEVGLTGEIPAAENPAPTTAVTDDALAGFLPDSASESHSDAEASSQSQQDPQNPRPFTKAPALESTDVEIPEEERVGVRSPFKSKEERERELAEANAKLELDRSKAPLSSNFKAAVSVSIPGKGKGRDKPSPAKSANGIDITAFMPSGETDKPRKEPRSEPTAKDPTGLLGRLPEKRIVPTESTEESLMPDIEAAATPVSDDLMADFLPASDPKATTEVERVKVPEETAPVAPRSTDEPQREETTSQSYHDPQPDTGDEALFPEVDAPLGADETESADTPPIVRDEPSSEPAGVTQPPEARDTPARVTIPSSLVEGGKARAEEDCLFPDVDAEAEVPPTVTEPVSIPTEEPPVFPEALETDVSLLTKEETEVPKADTKPQHDLPPVRVKEPTAEPNWRGKRTGKTRTGPKQRPPKAEVALARAKAMVTEFREQLKVGRGVWLPYGMTESRFGRTADYRAFEEAVVAERLDMFFISEVAAQFNDGPKITFDLKNRTATLGVIN